MFLLEDSQKQVDQKIDIKTRIIVTMASTIAQHTPIEYRKILYAAFSNGITPVEIKEVQLHFQKFLSANRFGDYQTHPVFDVKMRELLTFSILVSLGGADAQVKGHVQANVDVGNDKQTFLAVTTQLLPYIGYPKTLNAVTCINEIIPQKK